MVGPLLTDMAPSVADAAALMVYPCSLRLPARYGSRSRSTSGSVATKQQIDALVNHAVDVKEWDLRRYGAPKVRLETLENLNPLSKVKRHSPRHIRYPENATSFVEEARRLGLKSGIRPTEKD